MKTFLLILLVSISFAFEANSQSLSRLLENESRFKVTSVREANLRHGTWEWNRPRVVDWSTAFNVTSKKIRYCSPKDDVRITWDIINSKVTNKLSDPQLIIDAIEDGGEKVTIMITKFEDLFEVNYQISVIYKSKIVSFACKMKTEKELDFCF
jgi:hypothetical protein